MNIRLLPAALALPFLLAACGPATPATEVDCGAGESFEADGATFCVFRSAITEEGFDCPADVSMGRRFGDLVVCSEGGGDVPPDLFDQIPERFEDTELPTGPCANVLCDLDQLCDDGTCAVPFDEDQCFEDCGVGCPAPEFWVCASDGKRYCNECVIGCRDLQVADDATSCETETEEQCIESCGEGCVAPEFQPCASDGNTYCNECVIECKGLTVEGAETCGG
jgi:hypothetical protein